MSLSKLMEFKVFENQLHAAGERWRHPELLDERRGLNVIANIYVIITVVEITLNVIIAVNICVLYVCVLGLGVIGSRLPFGRYNS